MDRARFEELVALAIDGLPEEFRERLHNVDIVVADFPSAGELARLRQGQRGTLLGLYQGVPQTKRGRHYGLVTPDKITIFQRPIEAKCRNDDEVAAVVGRVVRHEIAHHFGIAEGRLRQLERGEVFRKEENEP